LSGRGSAIPEIAHVVPSYWRRCPANLLRGGDLDAGEGGTGFDRLRIVQVTRPETNAAYGAWIVKLLDGGIVK
jgi:hypothetical protein